jgi:hypothetical protein
MIGTTITPTPAQVVLGHLVIPRDHHGRLGMDSLGFRSADPWSEQDMKIGRSAGHWLAFM